MSQHPADADYMLHRAEREAIMAIQATDRQAAAIHEELSGHYSRAARAMLRAPAAPTPPPAAFPLPAGRPTPAG